MLPHHSSTLSNRHPNRGVPATPRLSGRLRVARKAFLLGQNNPIRELDTIAIINELYDERCWLRRGREPFFAAVTAHFSPQTRPGGMAGQPTPPCSVHARGQQSTKDSTCGWEEFPSIRLDHAQPLLHSRSSFLHAIRRLSHTAPPIADSPAEMSDSLVTTSPPLAASLMGRPSVDGQCGRLQRFPQRHCAETKNGSKIRAPARFPLMVEKLSIVVRSFKSTNSCHTGSRRREKCLNAGSRRT